MSKPELVSLNHLSVIQYSWSTPVFCTPAVWGLLSDAIAEHGYDLRSLAAEILHQIKHESEKQPFLNVVFFSLQIAGDELEFKAVLGPYDEPTCVLTVMLAGEE